MTRTRTAAFVYDDFVSKPWTHVHFQDLYCDQHYKSHADSFEHCLKGAPPFVACNGTTMQN